MTKQRWALSSPGIFSVSTQVRRRDFFFRAYEWVTRELNQSRSAVVHRATRSLALHTPVHRPQQLPERQHDSHHERLRRSFRGANYSAGRRCLCCQRHHQRAACSFAVPHRFLRRV